MLSLLAAGERFRVETTTEECTKIGDCRKEVRDEWIRADENWNSTLQRCSADESRSTDSVRRREVAVVETWKLKDEVK